MRVTYICIYMYVTVCMCICMRVCEFLPFFFSLLFLFFETVSQSTAQAGLGLLISLLMLPSAGIIGACHCPWPCRSVFWLSCCLPPLETEAL